MPSRGRAARGAGSPGAHAGGAAAPGVEPRGLKIGEVSRRSGVPVGTIKFYLREGLIPPPLEAGRNMARYDAGVVERIRLVKELQEKRFLPLKVIRAMLEAGLSGEALATRDALSAAAELALAGGGADASAVDALAAEALTPAERRALEQGGVLGSGGAAAQDPRLAAIDARILSSVLALRRAGFTRRRGFGAERLIVYADAVRALVAEELERVVSDVVGHLPPEDAPQMLSRALDLMGEVILDLRKKALFGMIAGLAGAMPPASAAGRRRGPPRG